MFAIWFAACFEGTWKILFEISDAWVCKLTFEYLEEISIWQNCQNVQDSKNITKIQKNSQKSTKIQKNRQKFTKIKIVDF